MVKVKDVGVEKLSEKESALKKVPFFGGLVDSFKHFMTKYDKLDVQIEKIEEKLETAKVDLLKSIDLLDKLYEKNLENSSVFISVSAADAVFDHEFHRTDNIKDIIMGEKILKVLNFPLITFKSTEVIITNADQFKAYGEESSVITATIKGDMTLVGITRPFEMEVTFHEKTGMTSRGRMVAAFSSYGTFKRSDFGVNYGLDRVGIRRMGDEVIVMTSITAHRSD